MSLQLDQKIESIFQTYNWIDDVDSIEYDESKLLVIVKLKPMKDFRDFQFEELTAQGIEVMAIIPMFHYPTGGYLIMILAPKRTKCRDCGGVH